jgi:hypothetical protein
MEIFMSLLRALFCIFLSLSSSSSFGMQKNYHADVLNAITNFNKKHFDAALIAYKQTNPSPHAIAELLETAHIQNIEAAQLQYKPIKHIGNLAWDGFWLLFWYPFTKLRIDKKVRTDADLLAHLALILFGTYMTLAKSRDVATDCYDLIYEPNTIQEKQKIAQYFVQELSKLHAMHYY